MAELSFFVDEDKLFSSLARAVGLHIPYDIDEICHTAEILLGTMEESKVMGYSGKIRISMVQFDRDTLTITITGEPPEGVLLWAKRLQTLAES
jgi:hypothetical protein